MYNIGNIGSSNNCKCLIWHTKADYLKLYYLNNGHVTHMSIFLNMPKPVQGSYKCLTHWSYLLHLISGKRDIESLKSFVLEEAEKLAENQLARD